MCFNPNLVYFEDIFLNRNISTWIKAVYSATKIIYIYIVFMIFSGKLFYLEILEW